MPEAHPARASVTSDGDTLSNVHEVKLQTGFEPTSNTLLIDGRYVRSVVIYVLK